MGQHKNNPTAIAAREGKLPPKPKKTGSREADRLLMAKCREIIYGPLIDTYINCQDMEYVKKLEGK